MDVITQIFTNDFSESLRLEDWLYSQSFLTKNDCSRLILISNEILENIVAHSNDLLGKKVIFRIRKNSKHIYLTVFFKSTNFENYAKSRKYIKETAYDPISERYHGLGMKMVKNLSKKLYFHCGSQLDSIMITL